MMAMAAKGPSSQREREMYLCICIHASLHIYIYICIYTYIYLYTHLLRRSLVAIMITARVPTMRTNKIIRIVKTYIQYLHIHICVKKHIWKNIFVKTSYMHIIYIRVCISSNDISFFDKMQQRLQCEDASALHQGPKTDQNPEACSLDCQIIESQSYLQPKTGQNKLWDNPWLSLI